MSEAPSDASSRLLVPALLLLVLIPWISSFQGGYVFDDSREITRSPKITSLTPLQRHFRGQRPVQSLTLALNYKVSGFNTWSYHLLNLLIHLGSTVTLFALTRLCLARLKDRPSWLQRPAYPAFALALLWGVHPLQTESVTYIVQRAESLMGLFYLLALLAVARGCGTERPLRWFGLAWLCGALGMLTKVVIGSMPVVALLLDRLFFSASFRETFRRRWAGHLILWSVWLVPLATGVLKKLVVGGGKGVVSAGLSLTYISKLDYLLSEAGVLLHYVRLVLLPVGQCLDYGWKPIESFGEAALPGLLVLIPLGLGFFLLARGRRVALPLLAFFFVLTPTSSIFPVLDLAAEHRMYLPSACVLALVLLGLWKLLGQSEGSRRILLGVIAVAYLGLGTATWNRNLVYADEAGMWRDVIEKAPENGRAYYQLAAIRYEAKDYEGARDRLTEALKYSPRYGLNYVLLAQLENRAGRFELSRAAAERAVKILPRLGAAWSVLGAAHFQMRDFNAAEQALTKAVELAPRSAYSFRLQAQVLVKKGEFGKAWGMLKRAFMLGDNSAELNSVRAAITRRRGFLDEARTLYEQALSENDEDPQIWLNYSLLLENMWRYEDALKAAREALRLDEGLARASLQEALMLDRLGRFDEALEALVRTSSLDQSQRGMMRQAAAQIERRVRARRQAAAGFDSFRDSTPAGATVATIVDSAEVAVIRGEFALAVRLYREAFAKQPSLADDLRASHRYNAAFAAARAGMFEPAAAWLRADLAVREKQFAAGGRDRAAAHTALSTWYIEPAFAPTRKPEAAAPWPSIWKRVLKLAEPE